MLFDQDFWNNGRFVQKAKIIGHLEDVFLTKSKRQNVRILPLAVSFNWYITHSRAFSYFVDHLSFYILLTRA